MSSTAQELADAHIGARPHPRRRAPTGRPASRAPSYGRAAPLRRRGRHLLRGQEESQRSIHHQFVAAEAQFVAAEEAHVEDLAINSSLQSRQLFG
jgi:hypothetical protein